MMLEIGEINGSCPKMLIDNGSAQMFAEKVIAKAPDMKSGQRVKPLCIQ